MRIAASPYRRAVAAATLTRRIGQVRRLGGLSIEVHGLDATVGELCAIWPRASRVEGSPSSPVLAEVVGVRADHLSLMPYGSVQGFSAGCEVVALGSQSQVGVGEGLLGRVIDGFGEPLDGLRYIATLQQSRADAEDEIAALTALMQRARAECSVQQQKLEVLDRHRQEARKDHSIERHRKDATEADQDWAARESHRTSVREASP